MTKKELLLKIDALIQEAKLEHDKGQENKDFIEQAFALGKENGLLWAKILIQELRSIV